MAEQGPPDGRRNTNKAHGISAALADLHVVGQPDTRFNRNRTRGNPPPATQTPQPVAKDPPPIQGEE